MSLEFTHPYYLTGLLLIALLIGAYRRSLVDFSRRQRLLSLAIRTAILSLIVFALAGLTLLFPTPQTMIVLLVDQSRSIDTAAAEARDQFIDQCKNAIPEERFGGIVPFGTADSTDIAAAFAPALAMIPPNYVSHLVVISDGNETRNNVLTTAARSGAVVSALPLPSSTDPEVQVTDIKMPSHVRQGEPFYLDVVIQSNVETEAVLTLYKNPLKLLEERKPLRIGENVF
ncbi:MAG: hypothetical protein LBI05_02340, partial [Planctomycetaceae bacterium]|nr:hypothetical protein [Planctomycetaceae bacterium]